MTKSVPSIFHSFESCIIREDDRLNSRFVDSLIWLSSYLEYIDFGRESKSGSLPIFLWGNSPQQAGVVGRLQQYSGRAMRTLNSPDCRDRPTLASVQLPTRHG
jgi:hypothetical protein